MENRFYVASDKLQEIAIELINKGYQELDSCLDDEDELASKIFIDTEKRSFYYTDEECLKQTNLILVEKFKNSYKSIIFKEVKKWK